MAGLTFGTVQDPSTVLTPDNASGNFNMGHSNELLVAEILGKYYHHNYRRNLYIGSTSTAGATIVIASTLTGLSYTIWNPQFSNVLCVPIVTLIAWNATTGVLGSLVWMATTNAGSTTGGTFPIVSFTSPATPISANLGAEKLANAKASKMNFGNQGTTISLTAAATVYRGLGMTITAVTAGTTTVGSWVWRDDWDGNCIIPPGNAIHLMGSTAVAATLFVSTIWAELPL